MKAIFVKTPSAKYLITSSENTLTLLDASSELKLISQQSLNEEFVLIPMVSPQLFATIGYDKKFRIWAIEEKSTLVLKYCCSFPKKLTHGASFILSSKEFCFITDKYGDVYSIDIVKAMASHEFEGKIIRQDYIGPSNENDLICKFIMGHQEAINLLEINKNYLVTVDTANKIKVSYVPKFYEIHEIYFGHYKNIVFAKLLGESTLLTIDKERCAIIWDISKDAENAIVFQGKVGDGNIVALNTFGKELLEIVDKSIELYKIDYENKTFIQKEKKSLPDDFECIGLLNDAKKILIGMNKKTKTIQAIPY